jgi:hypothetical protein
LDWFKDFRIKVTLSQRLSSHDKVTDSFKRAQKIVRVPSFIFPPLHDSHSQGCSHKERKE